MTMYGIMRVEKRKRSAVYGLQIEADRTPAEHKQGREFYASDIDWEKTTDNKYLVKTENWNRAITRTIKENSLKEKKDSVVMLDGIYTASPEFFKNKPKWMYESFFDECLAFHVQEYCQGDRSRVLNAVIHYDETTPHLHISSIPLYQDEKGAHLSAKIIMGNKGDYSKHQDRFYEQVSSKYELERGEIKDALEKKTHVLKREWQLQKIKDKTKAAIKYHNDVVDIATALQKGNYKLAKKICLEHERAYNGIARERT